MLIFVYSPRSLPNIFLRAPRKEKQRRIGDRRLDIEIQTSFSSNRSPILFFFSHRARSATEGSERNEGRETNLKAFPARESEQRASLHGNSSSPSVSFPISSRYSLLCDSRCVGKVKQKVKRKKNYVARLWSLKTNFYEHVLVERPEERLQPQH